MVENKWRWLLRNQMSVDLKDKLQFACDYPEEVKKLKAGSAGFICKKYSWDDVVKQTLKLYQKQMR